MKLFQKLLVAPAALGLLAPAAANAGELNISSLNLSGVSDYAADSSSSSYEQVTSITQFSDVYPTDWAYQALSNLIERYGCVAGYPNGTYRGNRAMTRFEAAALLNACLDRVTEVTDELKRLMKEFEKELAILKGRVDGLEARVGELEATQFSTTTKLKGKTTFVIGGNAFGGDAEVNEQLGFQKRAGGVEKSKSMAGLANRNLGATTFNYDQQLEFLTSFTGKDLLKLRLRAGSFQNSAFGFDASTGISTPLGGEYLTRSGMEAAFGESLVSNAVKVNRVFYQFPLGENFTVTAGGVVRQDDMLAVWPSAYPADTVLDVFTYAGAPGTYNLNLGAGAGLWWEKDGFSVSANYVSSNGADSNPNSGGIATDGAGGTGTVQLAYTADQWGVAAAYNYTSENVGVVNNGTATPLATLAGTEGNTNSFGLSAYWSPEESGWIPSISTGWGINKTNGNGDSFNAAALLLPGTTVEFDGATSQSWYVGLQWSDVFLKGNSAGMAVGQTAFITSLDLDGTGSSEVEDILTRDGNYAWEWWYKFQVTDNIAVTPALFYLSRPLGSVNQGNTFRQFGGLVKTTFKF